MVGRGLGMVTLVAGNKTGNGKSGYGQWLWQRGWLAFDGGSNRGSVQDTAARITTGERGMMVATMVCVCVLVCVERPQKIWKRAES